MPFACRCLTTRREHVAVARAEPPGQGQSHPGGLGFSTGWMQVQGGWLTAEAGSLLHYDVTQFLPGISRSLSSLAIMHIIAAWTYSLF